MPSSQKHADRISALVPLVYSGAVLLFLYRAALLFAYPVGHDQSWYLIAARRYLDGATLYGPQIAETNPPLIIWFSALPILLARFLHVSPVTALRLIVLAGVLVSTAWCALLMRRRPAGSSFNPGALSLALLTCAVLYVEFRIGLLSFAQREQLLVILALPYILAATTGAVRHLSLPERCALGIAAGLGICFKPQYLIVIAALEIFLALYNRTLRRAVSPEFLSLVLTGAIYLVLVRLLTPLYGTRTVPLLLDVYWAYSTSGPLALARGTRGFLLITIVAPLACFALRKYLRDPLTPMAFVVCSIAAYVAYVIQKTDWRYHQDPYKAFFLFAALYLLIDLLQPFLARLEAETAFTRVVSFAALALQLIALCAIAIRPHRFIPATRLSEPPSLGHFFAQYPPSTTVYVFSTGVYPISGALVHNLRWGSRFPALWMLPAIILNETGPLNPSAPFKRLPPETLTRLASLQRTEMAEDFDTWQPSVVLVEQCTLGHPCQAIEGKNVDLIAWFKQGPQFTAAWSHYQPCPGPPDFDCYLRVN